MYVSFFYNGEKNSQVDGTHLAFNQKYQNIGQLTRFLKTKNW